MDGEFSDDFTNGYRDGFVTGYTDGVSDGRIQGYQDAKRLAFQALRGDEVATASLELAIGEL